MYVINGNIENPSIVILPNILVPKGVTEINGKLEFIDDETQTKYEFDGLFTIDGDFFVLEIDNSNPTLKAEKYYTMRMYNDLGVVVYRDKAFVSTQQDNPNQEKYDNNEGEYIEADSGNNDYIVL